MRIRARATLSAAVIAAMAAFGGAAGAAEGPSDGPSEAAIQRGLRLRKAGDDAGALPEFQNAYRLTLSPRAAAQLGLVEQALGHWDDAEVHLTEAIRTAGDAWVEKNRPALQRSLALVKDHVGTLQVTGDPEGADVYVNGRRRDRIPMSKPITVMAGDLDVEVRASGYKRAAQKVTIAAYQYRPLVIRLERLDGTGAAGPPAVASAPAGEAARGPQPVARPVSVGEPIDARPTAGAVGTVPGDAAAATADRQRSVWPVVGWSVAGAGAVTIAAGVLEAVAGQSKINAAASDADRANATANPTLYMTAAASFSDGSSQRTTGRVLMVAGGAVAAAGLVLALTTRHAADAGATSASGARLQPSIDLAAGRPTTAGLSMMGTW